MKGSTKQPPGGVTQLLLEWREGKPEALDRLTPVVYNELRSLARRYMRSESPGHMLQTTALVHEAYIRLIDADLEWQDRMHFFAIAARLMRQILVDFARERMAVKRGEGVVDLTLDEELVVGRQPPAQLIALDDALNSLAKIDSRKADVVELRFFGGLTIEETAASLAVSHATVERDFRMAKAWLTTQLDRQA